VPHGKHTFFITKNENLVMNSIQAIHKDHINRSALGTRWYLSLALSCNGLATFYKLETTSACLYPIFRDGFISIFFNFLQYYEFESDSQQHTAVSRYHKCSFLSVLHYLIPTDSTNIYYLTTLYQPQRYLT